MAAPNNILFVQNLPVDCNTETLEKIFGEFAGFREIRVISVKQVGFAEYDSEVQAEVAMSNLQGKVLAPGMPLHISYAKK